MMPTFRRASAAMLCALAVVHGAWAQNCDEHFLPGLQTQLAGVANTVVVNATCTFDPDDGGPQPRVLVVAGSINVAGGVLVDNIAQWDGTSWTELGDGLNSIVSAVVEFEGDLIVGGYFSNAGGDPAADRVARWNGTSWSAMGTLPGLQVEDLRVLGGVLHAVCNSGGNASSTAHRWNGAAWEQIGSAIPNAFLMAIEEFNGQVYVGGVFQNADGDATADGIAMFNGTTWQGVGGGLVGDVYDLRVHNNALYVGGQFNAAGGVGNANSIARWTGAAWEAVGTGLNTQCMAIEVLGGDIVAGGSFSHVDNPPSALTRGVARFNGAAWVPLGQGFGNQNAFARDLTLFNGELVAVGDIERSGGESFSGVSHFDGSTWLGFGGPGLGPVLAVAQFNGELIIGGEFLNAGGDPDADYIARWHNGNWAAVGEAFNGPVRALAVHLDELFAGGDFTNVGLPAHDADYLAKWNGTDWEVVGGGVDDQVTGLALFGDDLLVTGYFDDPGAGSALWSGTGWTALNGADATSMFAEALGTIYAASTFSGAVVRLNGTTWETFGPGALPNPPRGMAAFENKVVVSLPQVNIFGDPSLRFCIAWNGTAWEPTGTSAPNAGPVVVYQGRLIAGASPEVLENGAWLPLAPNSDAGQLTAAVIGDELIFGGTFVRMGGVFTPYVARLRGADTPADCDPAWAQPFSTVAKLNGKVTASYAWDHDGNDATPARWVIGGTFSKQGTQPLLRIGAWDEVDGLFDPMGAGFNGAVNALASFDHDGDPGTPEVPVAAGAFSKSGATPLKKIAWFDGALWQPLGEGLNGSVLALAVGDPDGTDPLPASLIAAGSFTKSGVTVVNRVARWDVGTQAWQPMGAGFNGTVRALEFFDSDGDLGVPARLHAGGSFTKSGAALVSRLGVFDGAAWSQAGTGLNGAVYALCAADPDGDGTDALYLGGAFKKTGVTPLARIAVFDGAAFSALGDGFNNTVLAIEAPDFDGCGPDAPQVIAGGQFGKSGAAVVSRLGVWDGAAWSSLGGGANTTVRSLCAIDGSVGDAPVNALLAAGDFKTIGTLAQKNVGLYTCPSVAPILAPGRAQPCSAADIAGQPGAPREHHPDGHVTVDDALAFVAMTLHADAEDAPTADEIIAFVRAYAEGCP